MSLQKMIYQFPTQSNNSRDGSIDVTGREIKVRKSVENKRFPGVGTVWMAVSIPGFFAFGKSVGTGQP